MLHLFRKHKSKGTPNGAPVTLPIDSKIAEALEEVEETTIRNLRAITKGANTVEQELKAATPRPKRAAGRK